MPGSGVSTFMVFITAHNAAWLVVITGLRNVRSQPAIKSMVGKLPPGTTSASTSGRSIRRNAASAAPASILPMA